MEGGGIGFSFPREEIIFIFFTASRLLRPTGVGGSLLAAAVV